MFLILGKHPRPWRKDIPKPPLLVPVGYIKMILGDFTVNGPEPRREGRSTVYHIAQKTDGGLSDRYV